MKNYLRTQITLYEEDKNYPIWRRQERRSKYAVQLASWQLRSNSPKTSVRSSVRPSVRPFAADDILLYKICYNIQWIYFTIWEKGKEELSPLHIISRHYKKSLLRSQIYHGYEELSTDTNYPIWRRQKLPYMKKTRKKKQVCGAACFMAAEIKFSEDVRLLARKNIEGPVRFFSNSLCRCA